MYAVIYVIGVFQPKQIKACKHFTTASEIKSYQEHPRKHKPHVSHYHELMMLCVACQLLFLTGYYSTIYAKQNTLPTGRWNTISDGVTQTSLFLVQQRK